MGSTIGQLLLGLLAALTINRLQKGGRLFRSLMLLPYAVPAISLALIWRWMFSDGTGILTFWLQSLSLFPANASPLGSADAALWLVVMANVWHGFPFAMLIYWAALQQIDPSLYEAASLDGANAWQKFRYIILPSLSAAFTFTPDHPRKSCPESGPPPPACGRGDNSDAHLGRVQDAVIPGGTGRARRSL